ncbi:hypothetical protein [Streptomyces sp. NRRL WC-3549]|uniref:hypothetical protein n=1 Tax=Streptomyces sp. NRRL WC-3549 TaxID=1463925 RepID=UPI0004C980CC|nr:hypothetical protein [Streptomyces sp. NRRL WC-3549]
MPRVTAAQVSYGSATVVLSALVMLLLSGTDSTAGTALTGTAALLPGLLVSMAAPRPRRAGTPTSAAPDVPIPAVRTERVGEHSLRR